MLNHVPLFVTPWTIACKAPLSMEFFRQEYRSGLPFPPSGALPNPGTEPRSLALRADSLPSEEAVCSRWPSFVDVCSGGKLVKDGESYLLFLASPV